MSGIRGRLPGTGELGVGDLAELAAYLDEALSCAADRWFGTPDPAIDCRAIAEAIESAREARGMEEIAATLRALSRALAEGEYSLVRERDIRPPRPDVVRTGRW